MDQLVYFGALVSEIAFIVLGLYIGYLGWETNWRPELSIKQAAKSAFLFSAGFVLVTLNFVLIIATLDRMLTVEISIALATGWMIFGICIFILCFIFLLIQYKVISLIRIQINRP